MIIRIDGDISAYFIQTLCLLYFPGAKFPNGESSAFDVPEVLIGVRDTSGGAEARVTLLLNGRSSTAEAAVTDVPSENTRRRAVGKAFIDAAGEMLDFYPPWGMLTGIRPSKLVSDKLQSGASDDECIKWLTGDYLVSHDKAALALEVAKAEMPYITENTDDSCSVYVAIPFCPSKCAYCSFVSYATPRLLSLIPQYLTVLADDIRRLFERIERDGKKVRTVYIGGGTPTVLTAEQLKLLLSVIKAELGASKPFEFTVEAGRPDTITAEKLAVCREYGVDRISVNTQTLNDSILASLGRKHTSDDFFRAYEIAKASGIPNINVDLIAALPSEAADSFQNSLAGVARLKPSNITVHTFTVKKSAELRFADGGAYDRDGLIAVQDTAFSYSHLTKIGYKPYYMYRQKNTVGNLENVGWCLPGCECRYNIYMMEEVHSIYAAGASSVTKIVTRTENGVKIARESAPKYPFEYLARKDHD